MSFPAQSGSTVAEIDLAALTHNLGEIRRVARSAGILAAVKADAYGHGAVEVARLLEHEGVSMLGVARIEEGIELREANVDAPILVLSGVPTGGPGAFESLDDRISEILKYRLTPVLFDVRQMLAIDRNLQRRQLASEESGNPNLVRIQYHLKIDTGMGRIGVPAEVLREALPVLGSLKHMKLAGACTHFADADDESEAAQSFTKAQLESFRSAIPPLRALCEGDLLLHASNSAAVVRGVGTNLDLIRPGIALYGAYPSDADRDRIRLKPVMRVSTRVLFVKDLPAGATVSYGRTFVTERASRVATLPVGYGDGYPRALSNQGEVLVRGKRARIVGRVCMDLTMVDVTDIPDVAPGDEAVLIGTQQEERISAEEVASKAGTISYEILTQISKRVPRVYHR